MNSYGCIYIFGLFLKISRTSFIRPFTMSISRAFLINSLLTSKVAHSSNACYTVWCCDVCKSCAMIECLISYVCHTIRLSIILYTIWYYNWAVILSIKLKVSPNTVTEWTMKKQYSHAVEYTHWLCVYTRSRYIHRMSINCPCTLLKFGEFSVLDLKQYAFLCRWISPHWQRKIA